MLTDILLLTPQKKSFYLCPTMSDILGQALLDYYEGRSRYKLWIHNQYGPKEEMPVAAYFRDEDDMPDLEWLALNECRGKILDIGAGAGSHALWLQQQGQEVSALDISPRAVQVMKARGVTNAFEGDIYAFNQGKFDTLLIMMNGIGLAGTLSGLKGLLLHLKTLLNPGGQLLFDSSDIAYLYNGALPSTGYYGQIAYQYQYNRQQSTWFNWLYVDEQTLQGIATETGFNMEVLLEDEFGQYLLRLTA